jgi:hypothetical protein
MEKIEKYIDVENVIHEWCQSISFSNREMSENFPKGLRIISVVKCNCSDHNIPKIIRRISEHFFFILINRVVLPWNEILFLKTCLD